MTLNPGSSRNALQYTSRENDDTGLYYYRARYYSPTLHRFISEDPIGLGGGDENFYAYTYNSPTNYTDPSGTIIAPALGCLAGIALDNILSGRKPETQTFGSAAASCAAGAVGGGAVGAAGKSVLKSLAKRFASRGGNAGKRGTFPDEIFSGKSPKQRSPTGRNETIEHTRYNPRTGESEASRVNYDQYGRQTSRTDYTDHGYPGSHSNPHHHTTEYGPGFGAGRNSGPLSGPF